MLSQLRSIWEVFRHTFRPADTVQYPEQKPYLAPRFRGRIVLTLDPDGDERCVAPDHEQSNYRMIREALLDRVAIPEENVLRLKGEITPAKAADEYEKLLRQRAGDEVFRHDLLLLGMGEDGHTASLFPATRALEERDRWVVANKVTELAACRLTFTYSLINAARRVLFLVRGNSKRRIVEEILHGGADCYPAAGVQPEDGTLVWLLGR